MRTLGSRTNDELASSSPATTTNGSDPQDCETPDGHDPIVKPKRFRRKRSRLRKQTLAAKRISQESLRSWDRELELEGIDKPSSDERPRVRSECPVARPCQWVSCKHNLYLDVHPENGSITFNFPELDPWEIPAERSCCLDVAELGGLTLEDTGVYVNLTRERIRQIEVKAYMMLREHIRKLGVDCTVGPGMASTEPCGDGEDNYI